MFCFKQLHKRNAFFNPVYDTVAAPFHNSKFFPQRNITDNLLPVWWVVLIKHESHSHRHNTHTGRNFGSQIFSRDFGKNCQTQSAHTLCSQTRYPAGCFGFFIPNKTPIRFGTVRLFLAGGHFLVALLLRVVFFSSQLFALLSRRVGRRTLHVTFSKPTRAITLANTHKLSWKRA